jgi:hypothetical protein
MSSTEKKTLLFAIMLYGTLKTYIMLIMSSTEKKTLLFATNVAWPQNTVMRDHKKLNAMHSSIKWWFPTHK